MNRILRAFAILAIATLVGCNKHDPNPIYASGEGPYIDVRVTNNTIRGFVGEQRTMQVIAIVRNNQNIVVSGAPVSFNIADTAAWMGSVGYASEVDTTDINGQVFGVYSVELERAGDVTIEARSGGVVGTKTIRLETFSEARYSLSFEAPDTALDAGSGDVEVTAVVRDSIGIGVDGVLVHFAFSPRNLGSNTSGVATSDHNGRAKVILTFPPGRYGFVQIAATVGDSIAVLTIQVVPVSRPAHIYVQTSARLDSLPVPAGVDSVVQISLYYTDRNQVGVPDGVVHSEAAIEAVGDQPTFGHLERRGDTAFDFHTDAQYGIERIHIWGTWPGMGVDDTLHAFLPVEVVPQ